MSKADHTYLTDYVQIIPCDVIKKCFRKFFIAKSNRYYAPKNLISLEQYKAVFTHFFYNVSVYYLALFVADAFPWSFLKPLFSHKTAKFFEINIYESFLT